MYFKQDFDKLPYYILDSIEKGRKIYFSQFFNNKLGYNTFTKIKNYNACCNYIIKYISKDPLRNENDQVYFCSKGLKKCFCEEFLKYYDEKFLVGGHDTFIETVNPYTGEITKKLVCRVKDIYKDNFNQATKTDYLIDSIFNDNFL